MSNIILIYIRWYLRLFRYIHKYVAMRANHYLHLDERLIATPFFIPAIRDIARKELKKRRNKWTVIEFASSSSSSSFKGNATSLEAGFPRGAFLRMNDLEKLTYFMSTFSGGVNASGGSMYDVFLRIVSQGVRLEPRPALFHRYGLNWCFNVLANIL